MSSMTLIVSWTVMTAGVWGTVVSVWLHGFEFTPVMAVSLTCGLFGGLVVWEEVTD